MTLGRKKRKFTTLKAFDDQGDINFEEFAEEIHENMDNIKSLSLLYLEKIMAICGKNGYRLNPANIIKYAYQFSVDPEVHELAYRNTMLIKQLGLYKGFTIEYIDYYTQKKSTLGYNPELE